MIIGFLNQKGGAGKSTMAVNVAAEIAASGARVQVIDADPQASLVKWCAARGDRVSPFKVIPFDRLTLNTEIASLSRAYDYTIIDGPARDAALQRSAILACDRVAIPFQPSGFDLWSTDDFRELLGLAQPFAPGQTAALVTSCGSSRGVLAGRLRDAIGSLGLPIIDGTTRRLAYVEAVTAAMTIHELAALPGPKRAREAREVARAEIAALTHSLLTLEAPAHV